ncbi:HAD family hydrolase [Sediminibacillus halophilus]|uniref:Putative hydrolase of the HAD superfamily n=1 Tax=Sediminibacillus halophilus TaxID=482461 RepID=A0A1G9P5F9_9BACI|nr:HAD family hydrolase [Sediminibacillus halophilus]SDL93944.1 putative hydrolase of the HAD superfamily [Sediminibacillus halophilus]
MIQAVLFDLDGTMLDRERSIRLFIQGQYDRMEDYLRHADKEEFIEAFMKLDAGGYVWKDKVYQQLVNEFSIKSVSWQELLDDYISQFRHSCIPFPNLVSVLETLKNKRLKLGVITNGRYPFQLDTIKALGVERFFDLLLISEKEGIRKPDPAIFHRASKQLNVPLEKCLFVGDHPKKDIAAAGNTGMVTVWKKTTGDSAKEADYTIRHLEELLEIEVVNK